jgi:hypothetical protein
MTHPDPAAVARGLSEAQRRAVTKASPLMVGGKLRYLAAYRDGGRLHQQLVDAGVAVRTFNGVRLTPLGLAVRAALGGA